MSVKVQFVISDEAMEVINSNATERKRGDWLSSAVVEYHRILNGVPVHSDNTDNGLLERIESRLARIEKQLAAMLTSKA